ncbi:hypothetical protein SAMN05443574_1352 [Haloarcula vallismortis]|uniref:DUF7344 domain-containing protein n=2 Tax=Haloarcula vallismortis TaxID=28442 RepID=M0J559_HALVA|nr:hypothetical protein [Haloarcula vallismortis]EMA04277.1 hypothetical protein C437_13992 [Haloarcula vallismortis ATCC 29715]SDX35226.1 hypothetical protein SAMN05443574_1352 [Haloarcula vallismortis]
MNLEDVHDVLRSEDRRAVVRRLANTEATSLALDELAQAVGDFARDGDGDREQLCASLHHWHLPKLSQYDIVDYDAETGCVRSGPHLPIVATVGTAASSAFSGAGDRVSDRDTVPARQEGERA